MRDVGADGCGNKKGRVEANLMSFRSLLTVVMVVLGSIAHAEESRRTASTVMPGCRALLAKALGDKLNRGINTGRCLVSLEAMSYVVDCSQMTTIEMLRVVIQ